MTTEYLIINNSDNYPLLSTTDKEKVFSYLYKNNTIYERDRDFDCSCYREVEESDFLECYIPDLLHKTGLQNFEKLFSGINYNTLNKLFSEIDYNTDEGLEELISAMLHCIYTSRTYENFKTDEF